MPSRVTYMNQSTPFWDFLASMDQQGSNPWSPQNRNEHQNNEGQHHPPPPPFEPWGWGQFFGGGQGMPHRGPPPSGPPSHEHHDTAVEKDGKGNDDNDNDHGEGTPDESGSDNENYAQGPGGNGRHCGRGHHGFGGRGGFGPRHGPRGHGPRHGHPSQHGGLGSRHGPPHHSGPGPHHGPPHAGPQFHHDGPRQSGRGNCGSWGRGESSSGNGPFGRGGPFGGRFGGFDPSTLANNFWNQFVNPNSTSNTDNTGDFTPQADIFDTPSSYVIHISLPGAKKEDVGVNWDSENSELSIAGVIYRPGDEEFLKTLALNERSVGPFERKVRLGTRALPAHIDVDGISAKLEDGVLRVEVPKLGDTGFVEIRKVDIE